MDEFFFMGGYAPFIWPSYGIGIGGLVVLAVFSIRTLKARERELLLLQKKLGNITTQKYIIARDSTGTEICQQEEGTIHGTIHES